MFFRIAIVSILLTVPQLFGAISIIYSVAPAGGGSPDNVYRYTYLLSGSVAENQEVDIQFDPDLFRRLMNATASSGFDVLLLQPNNPPGVPGDLSALALNNITGPSTLGVDVVYLGTGIPGVQPFFINTVGAGGELTLVESGSTVSASAVPEPGTFLFTGGTFVICSGTIMLRRRSRRSM
jgi:hypothetical protein